MTDVDLAGTARLIGDPARAAMLDALVAGVPLPAGSAWRSTTRWSPAGHCGWTPTGAR